MTDTLGYVRVSTEQQAGEHNTSLPEQRRAITAHALKLGRALSPDHIFEDPGVSGATAEGRPGFMAMLSYCESRPTTRGVIVVLNDSRFGRFNDPEEATHWRFVLKRLGWIVRFAEGDEVQDGTARSVLRVIGAAQATEYRQNLRRTARRASKATAEQGRWGREAPMGYRRLASRSDGTQRILDIGQQKAADEIVRLTPGPEAEQEIVRWMFEQYGSGIESLYTLALALTTKWPARKWSAQTVRHTLLNPAYVGDVVHGRKPMDDAGNQRLEKDESQWLVIPDTHPALVSRDMFAKVQEVLASHRGLRKGTSSTYALSGLIMCCGCGMGYVGGGGNKGPGERWAFYKCRGADNLVGPCSKPLITLNKRWAEGTVIEIIGNLLTEPTAQKVIEDTLRTMYRDAMDTSSTRKVSLDREREALLGKRKRLVDQIAAGAILQHEATTTLSEVRSRLAALDAEMERVRFSERASARLDEECAQLIAVAKDFTQHANTATGAELRELVRPWLHNAVVTKEDRTLRLIVNRLPAHQGLTLMSHWPGPALQENSIVRANVPIPPKGSPLIQRAI